MSGGSRKNRTPITGVPYARMLGVEVERSENGWLVVLPFREANVGNARLPALHGGVVGAFLELTALVELTRQLHSAGTPKPINFSIDYLRSAGADDTFGRAEIIKHGRRIANVRVSAWQSDETKPVAAGIGNFLL